MKNFFIPTKENKFKPYLLSKAALCTYSILLILLNSFGGLLGISGVEASSITEVNIVALTNQARTASGLNTLNIDPRLSAAAQAKANNMFELQYWDHFGPNGETPWQFIRGAGYTYVYAGENLAKGFRTSEGVHEAWMASPTHKENIMSPNYKDIGVAVVSGTLLGQETILVVQMFGNQTSDVAVMSETSVPTKVDTTTPTVQETGQIKSIRITSPVSGTVTTDSGINISGEVENISGEYTVEILDTDELTGETISLESTWEYEKDSDWEEGNHVFKAQIKGENVVSDEVTLLVDSTAPTVEESTLAVKNDEESFTVSFEYTGDLYSVKFITGDTTMDVEVVEGTTQTFTVEKDILGERSILILSDINGNSSELDISEYFEEGDTVNYKAPFYTNLINSVKSTDFISLSIVMFIFILLCIEVYVYWKQGKLGTQSGSLLVVGSWWLILIMALFNGFEGVIT